MSEGYDYVNGYEKGFSDAEALFRQSIQTLERKVELLKETPSVTALQSRVAWLQAELDRATAGKHWKVGPVEREELA